MLNLLNPVKGHGLFSAYDFQRNSKRGENIYEFCHTVCCRQLSRKISEQNHQVHIGQSQLLQSSQMVTATKRRSCDNQAYSKSWYSQKQEVYHGRSYLDHN